MDVVMEDAACVALDTACDPVPIDTACTTFDPVATDTACTTCDPVAIDTACDLVEVVKKRRTSRLSKKPVRAELDEIQPKRKKVSNEAKPPRKPKVVAKKLTSEANSDKAVQTPCKIETAKAAPKRPLLTPQLSAELETLRQLAKTVFADSAPNMALIQELVAKDLEIAELQRQLSRKRRRIPTAEPPTPDESMRAHPAEPQQASESTEHASVTDVSEKRAKEQGSGSSQPSVLQFFAPKPLLVSSLEARENVTNVVEPNLESYLRFWKKQASLRHPKTVTFRKDRKILQYWEIPSKRPSQVSHLSQVRVVFISIHDRERPPVKLLLTYASSNVTGRRPLGVDPAVDYEKDSDDEWVEEHEGEDLGDDLDDEEEELVAPESEADSFLVSDGHFSEDEVLSEDEAMVARRLSRLSTDVQEERPSRPGTLSMICLSPKDFETTTVLPLHCEKWRDLLTNAKGGIAVFDPESYFNYVVAQPVVKAARIVKPAKPMRPVIDRAALARFIHGKSTNVDSLVAEFKAAHPGVHGVKLEIRTMAAWTKGATGRVAWNVKAELFESLGLSAEEMESLVNERSDHAVAAPKSAGRKRNLKDLLAPVVEDSEALSRAAIIHN